VFFCIFEKQKMKIKHLISIALGIALFWACNSDKKEVATTDFEVKTHLQGAPDALHPYLYQSSSSNEILKNVYQSLLSYNIENFEIVPVLAKQRPNITFTDSLCYLAFEIHPAAKWDNGSEITAKDVEFSLKVIKNKYTNANRVRGYLEFIRNIQLDDKNPKKFILICDNLFSNTESFAGDFEILPQYKFDSLGLLNDFPINYLDAREDTIKNEKNLVEFATYFNAENIISNPQTASGSGAYKIVSWEKDNEIVLEKKANWWANDLAKNNPIFESNPKKLVYKVISEQSVAVLALKNADIDIMKGVNPNDFTMLKNDSLFSSKYNFYTPPTFAYAYLGMNNTHPILSDKNVRLAIGHLTDVENIVSKIQQGYAQTVIGPINPSLKNDYNFDIKPYEYDITIASDLLASSGWSDTDNNGILDKIIKGKKTELALTYTYNAENKQREATGLLLKDALKKVGISLSLKPLEWTQFLQAMNGRNLELFYGAIGTGPIANDHSQLFHSEAIKNGSNYVNFSNQVADSLITMLKNETSIEVQNKLNKEFQLLLHNEVPCVFLFSPTERIIVSNKFDNLSINSQRPGYWTAGFRLK
jgi:ABC-type transport system substrate-binding protein